MAVSKKSLNNSRYGLSGIKKKTAINIWRTTFTGNEKLSGTECTFFLELELLNPWLSPSEPLLGYKPRINITEEDLQYALAGTQSAQDLETEALVQPSYIVVRFGKLGAEAKQICVYHSFSEVKFSTKPFAIQAGNKVFTDDTLSGFINLPEEHQQKHPEYLCNYGYASWNLKYEILRDYSEGFESKTDKWFPYGAKTSFSGMVNYDGNDYVIEPRKCFGYMDRYWGKSLPEEWFHISTSNLTSLISGKTLFDSNFAIQGIFDGRIAFLGNFEGAELKFTADTAKRAYTTTCNCQQSPVPDEQEDELLHWSVSINDKIWVVDVDIYCKIKDLYNRKLELPEGHRQTMDVLIGAAGTGEIKIFKRIKNTLEQIEYARIGKATCEFGHTEKTSE